MDWVRQNWVFILFFVIFIGMHLFGHGCMGGHDRHGEEEGEEHKDHEGKGSYEKKKGGHGCC